jgi:hypothetical protein
MVMGVTKKATKIPSMNFSPPSRPNNAPKTTEIPTTTAMGDVAEGCLGQPLRGVGNPVLLRLDDGDRITPITPVAVGLPAPFTGGIHQSPS